MAKRMKLIAEDEYERFVKKSSPIKDAKEHFFHDVHTDSENVLSNNEIPDDIKIQLYSSVMRHVKDKLHQALSEPINVKISGLSEKSVVDNSVDKNMTFSTGSTTSTSSPIGSFSSAKLNDSYTEPPFTPTSVSRDHVLLQNIPIKIRFDKIIPLMELLKARPDLIQWDKNGRVTFFGTEAVSGSNIVDMLNYATRELKWTKNPIGINRFLQVIKMVNVPTILLSRDVKQDVLGDLEHVRPRPNASNSASRLGNFDNWEPIRSADTLFSGAFDSTPRARNQQQNVNSGTKRRRRRNDGNTNT
jgi:hypothetical protein